MNTSLVAVLTITVVAVVTFAGCKWPCCCSCDSSCCSTQKTAATKTEAATIKAIESWTEFEQQVLQSTKPVVVDFYTTWCSACKELKPVFEKAAKELTSQYTFASVNIGVVEKAAQEYGIKGVPTIIFFKDGKPVESDKWIVGSTSDEQLKAAIEKAFGK